MNKRDVVPGSQQPILGALVPTPTGIVSAPYVSHSGAAPRPVTLPAPSTPQMMPIAHPGRPAPQPIIVQFKPIYPQTVTQAGQVPPPSPDLRETQPAVSASRLAADNRVSLAEGAPGATSLRATVGGVAGHPAFWAAIGLGVAYWMSRR